MLTENQTATTKDLNNKNKKKKWVESIVTTHVCVQIHIDILRSEK